MANYKVTIDEKELEAALAGVTAALTEFYYAWKDVALEVPPPPVTPPPAMQGHWVEPRSGRQLHIAADGVIVRDVDGDKSIPETYYLLQQWLRIENGFLHVAHMDLRKQGEDVFVWTPYCRKALDELRLRKWLKEKDNAYPR